MLIIEMINESRRAGYSMVSVAIPLTSPDSLCQEVDSWLEESRLQSGSWGVTSDGRPRFEADPSHSAGHSAL